MNSLNSLIALHETNQRLKEIHELPKKFKVVIEKTYGLSKIIFGFF